MTEILLINPNASEATTAMMVEIAAASMPPGFSVRGATARRGPSMIVNETELNAAATEVQDTVRAAGTGYAGIIISAFGDPGLDPVRAASRVPVVGIAEASMLEASARGTRRFGVATVTPDLVAAIEGRAAAAGLRGMYTGIRLTDGDPRALAAEPEKLTAALAIAVQRCIDDGAQAVIIGGGPLGQAALALAGRFSVPVIAPIPAAVRLVLERLKLP
jgi:Asp/Glu/hydantoin racemase